jgi:hypothetical protein
MAKRDRKDRVSPMHDTGKSKGVSDRPIQPPDPKSNDLKTKPRFSFRKDTIPEKHEQVKDKRFKPDRQKADIEPPSEKTLVKLEERFDKAFAISLGLIALLSLLFFIPLIGPIMGLTLVPYLACNRGCRYVTKANGLQVGILVGAIWSIIEVYLMFQILDYVSISVSPPGIITGLDITVIILLFTANLIFCMLGGITGGSKFEKLRSKNKVEEQV